MNVLRNSFASRLSLRVVIPNCRNNSTSSLRIAYFGTDAFSVKALEKLVIYQDANPGKISKIDVITRTVKPRGRKTKTCSELPIGEFHSERMSGKGSQIIRVDTKEDINQILKDNQYDLTVAISFGILIPREFLKSCRYGGLNVHPSLLPRYSGSSPIQYALMNQDAMTGCTVQTLHPTKFDHGDIVAQSEETPITETDDYESLVKKLGDLGSELLVKVIDKDLFIVKSQMHTPISQAKYKFSLAPKIIPSRSQIQWSTQSSKQIVALNKALGPLYTTKYVDVMKKNKDIREFYRVNVDGISEIELPSGLVEFCEPGDFMLHNDLLVAKTIDGAIAISKLKMQCCPEESPFKFVNTLGSRAGNTPNRFV